MAILAELGSLPVAIVASGRMKFRVQVIFWHSTPSFTHWREGGSAVTPRQLLHIVVALLVVVVSFPALAAKKDVATLKKIDEALNVHYLSAEYDEAEALLRAAIRACGTNLCSGVVLGKAHVAVGVIRGNAKQDLAGARAAFENAKSADPNTTLDASLVTRKVLLTFYDVMGQEPPPESAKPESSQPEVATPEVQRVSPAGDLRCTPASGYEIQTAQPIAIVCEPLEGVVRAELYYRAANESDYTAILMTVQDGTLRANIPCEPLTKPGKLELYVIAQDFNKEMIDTFGNIATPAHYVIVEQTNQPVPAYSGEPPPKRCEELLKGVGAEGQACIDTRPCKHGLHCADGICRKTPTCELSEDCESSRCNDGYCDMNLNVSDLETQPRRFLFGLHFGPDLWFATATKQVCGDASLRDENYSCYNSGYRQLFRSTAGMLSNMPVADPGSGGNTDAGFRLATLRLLLSGEYAVTHNLTIGGRLGWAFNGGPRAIHYYAGTYPSQGARFLPVHVEARGAWWFRSLAKPGFHPYAAVGAGLAEVDGKIPVTVRKTPTAATPGNPTERKLDAWRKMGLGFGTAALGALHTFGKHHGIQLNVNLMYMLPWTGLVLEPTLGYVYSL
jgi:hypothetical protein